MKNLILLFLFIQSINISKAQIYASKPPIDTSVPDKWERVDNAKISSDGKYAAYSILPHTLVILSTDHSWKKNFHLPEDGFFSSDNKQFIFRQKDSLYFVLLGKDSIKYITGVFSFKYSRNGKWLVYQLNKEIQLLHLSSGKQQHYSAITDYFFDDNGDALLLKEDHALKYINLSDGNINTIWSSPNFTAENITFDHQGIQLAFAAGSSIWHYKYGAQKAAMIAHDTLHIDAFSKNGTWLFVRQQKPANNFIIPKKGVMVDVWNYKDLYIQPQQALQSTEFTAVINLAEKKIVQPENDINVLRTSPTEVTGDHVVIAENDMVREYWWDTAVQPAFYLVSLKDGVKKLIPGKHLFNFSFSPHDKYLVYYNADQQAYFGMDIQDNRTYNLTKDIHNKISNEYINYNIRDAVSTLAAWEENDASLLIYDNYDIWKLDPSGKKPSSNVTNGYGNKNHIKLRLTDGPAALFQPSSFVYKKSDTVLLTAFNNLTKYNGFYLQTLNNKENPVQLTMGPYTYFKVESQKPFYYSFDDGMKPIKAANENIWIVKRQTAADAPNYFITRNFKTYDSISNIQPQKNYNWLTTELINWKLPDGTLSQGILYKPEDFDPKKKYPVIFNFYRQLSHRLYEFPYPQLANSNINIPFFVSQGYLVFTPDINYTETTAPITAVYQTVVSAAQHLATLPFINSKKMAIQGHSWGGAQINYLITHTNIFAAACEFAGITDNISSYLTLVPFNGPDEHSSRYSQTEWQFGALHSLWERKNEYLNSSTVLNADKITTPLLIIHNKSDNQISWRQGLELYMALRRLKKKTWMLQYDNSGHTINDEDAIDYTIRLNQFLDYYLKDKLPPVWMTRGIPAALKGIDNGLASDSSGLKP
jgi:dipeptidyl aminopeptidase/acylaminoacyl peptidase